MEEKPKRTFCSLRLVVASGLLEPPKGHLMGHLVYDGYAAEIAIEDRTLAHLQVVVLAKLRRNESFAFTWRDYPSEGDGESTIWLHSQVSLQFRYDGNSKGQLNRAWIEALRTSAESNSGLHLLPEPSQLLAGELL